MAFESLSNRLTAAFKHIVGKDKLSDKNMEAMLREIRTALLEADVNYKVVREFLERIRKEMVGVQVAESLDPSTMVYKIVRDEITRLLGDGQGELLYKQSGITTVMIVGLQGTGKTTSAAKIAKLIKEKQDRNPLLIAADIIRPAAIEQLQTLGKQIDCEVFTLGNKVSAVDTVEKGLAHARVNKFDTVIIDTAGRLHIDETLMHELDELKRKFRPDEILLTVDALTGQDIVNVAKVFDDLLNITGLMVTKFDGDARGGGVLSVKAVTDVPVKFVGTGEKVEDIDVFYPDRMASRILGMGDLQTLVEKAEEAFDMELANRAMENMMNGTFSLEDMLVQMKQTRKLGPIGNILKMLPGMNQFASHIDSVDTEGVFKTYEAIINSMTPYERRYPEELRSSHKNRIAKGSGTSVSEVNKLINGFDKTKRMMASMGLGKYRKF
ncbi:MAG TPA: signal recognition particle protein [Erysipelotrichaceae bacterium]|nr:signal recognition particle protein [Erysipelotrichia bacterium]HPX33265.1 signal recognition particle protein [Erysipelotrichaceae bacterium]HQA85660.1 signal recognition particle protein [Erysipelotrichaceae bacterium]